MTAAIFTVIYSFVLFWVIVLLKGGFSSMKEEAGEEEKIEFELNTDQQ